MRYYIEVLRIKKEAFWELYDEVIKYVIKEFCGLLDSYAKKNKKRAGELLFDDKALKLADLVGKKLLYLTFQLFECGEDYIVKPCDAVRFFYGSLSKNKEWMRWIEEVLVTQNKTDISEEDRRNEWLVEWIDDLIDRRHYYLAKVFDKEEAFYALYDYSMSRGSKPSEPADSEREK